jgi:hypothetical protein
MSKDPEADMDRLDAAFEEWCHAAFEAQMLPNHIEEPGVFGYVLYKAFTFLKVGPDEYRKSDALHQPPAHLPADRLDQIKRGCEQILEFRGLSPNRPLEGIGVGGFYALLRLFHFACERQTAFVGTTSDTLLDRMEMRHIADGRELMLYNLVTARPLGDRTDSETPCPYCGQRLRTASAKQCRHCGMDWHDPENVVCRKAEAK